MRIVMVALLVVMSPCAWADVTVIYRKTDRVIGGWVEPPQSVVKEIENVTNSELGGVPQDYATANVTDAAWRQARRQGLIPAIDRAGTVIFVATPRAKARDSAKRSARAKLKADGLTDEEIDALTADAP